MGVTEQTGNTIEDIYNLPDGQRAELIDGQIFMMAPENECCREICTRARMFFRRSRGRIGENMKRRKIHVFDKHLT